MTAPIATNRATATRFLTIAICEFFNTNEEKVAAVQDYLDAAGFDAKATCWPVFGGIWSKPCEGPDGAAASEWLEDVTSKLRRGEAGDELRQLVARLEERQAEGVRASG